MDIAEVFTDALTRVRDQVPNILDGLGEEALTWRPGPDANPIGWLVWHMTRVEDDHLSELADTEQVWTANGWYDRFALPFPPEAHGFGHSSAEVAQVRGVGADLLAGYNAEVAARSLEYVGGLGESDLDRVVDEGWDPPVTLGVRLVSVVGELHAHTGQAAYVRGLWERRTT